MKTQYALMLISIVLCLIGVFLMIDGSILDERTTGIATIAALVGISLISTSARKLRGQ